MKCTRFPLSPFFFFSHVSHAPILSNTHIESHFEFYTYLLFVFWKFLLHDSNLLIHSICFSSSRRHTVYLTFHFLCFHGNSSSSKFGIVKNLRTHLYQRSWVLRFDRCKISWRFDPLAITEWQRDERGRFETQETHARTGSAFMCPSKRGDASTGLFVGFSRIPDVSAESFVPFARCAIEYFRDVFKLVSDSRIFTPLFFTRFQYPSLSLFLLFFYPSVIFNWRTNQPFCWKILQTQNYVPIWIQISKSWDIFLFLNNLTSRI